MTLKQIAQYLRQEAHQITEVDDEDARISLTVPGTRLTITCRPTREAVLAIAAKYEKGSVHSNMAYKRPTIRKPPKPNSITVRDFHRDGDLLNLMAYLDQWPRDTWSKQDRDWYDAYTAPTLEIDNGHLPTL